MNETRELLVDRPAEGVLRLRMNRPNQLNAINADLVGALIEAFDEVNARAVVLGSSNPKAFCSGVDLGIEDAERTRSKRQVVRTLREDDPLAGPGRRGFEWACRRRRDADRRLRVT
jgi:enoyl-CoA hydratase/carnithine racemase